MKKKNKRIFIILGILLVLVALPILYSFHLLEKVENIDISKEDEDLGIKDEIIEKEEKEKPEIINIALFGLDNKDSLEKGRSDSIIIVSLDKIHKKIKMTSIMRDTYVDIPGRGMDKINHAYAFGGPKLSLKTINQNFDMNIRDFATVNFQGLEDIVNAFGGVEVNIKDYEISHVPGSVIGPQRLNGEQALAYSRIRKSGAGDFERTERQRLVLEALINKGLNMKVTQYPRMLDTTLEYVATSLSKSEILKLGTSIVTSNIKDIEKFRIPLDDYSHGKLIDNIYYLVPDTLQYNVDALHDFIYEE